MQIEDAIGRDPERMSGALCFKDTRIPVKALFDHLEAGKLEVFHEDFPGVSGEAILVIVAEAWRLLDARFESVTKAA